MFDSAVIGDAWPWLALAFLIGLVLGWLTTWLYYRDRVTAVETELEETRAAQLTGKAVPPAFSADELARASKIIGRKVRLNDLRIVEGIGPKIEKLMNEDGIRTWKGLADASKERLQKILDAAGNRYAMHDPGTWSRQSALLVDGKWKEFKQLTDELDGGR